MIGRLGPRHYRVAFTLNRKNEISQTMNLKKGTTQFSVIANFRDLNIGLVIAPKSHDGNRFDLLRNRRFTQQAARKTG